MNQTTSLIKNIGYMWHRNYVNWYRGAQLIGYPEQGGGKAINFADQAGVYALYNHNAECIYIGQAGSGEVNGMYHRLKDHAIKDYIFCMWERFTWFGFYSTETLQSNNFDNAFEISTNINELMNLFEMMAINIHFPRYNLSRGNISGIEWYYQKEEFDEQEHEFKSSKK